MSPRLTPTLLAIALASTLGFAPASTLAQTVQTSKGMRTLPRTDGFHSEAQYASAMRVAEGIADQVLADIAVIEAAQGSTTQQVSALSEDVKRANRDYDAAKAIFDQHNQKYLSDLAAFQQGQSALDADVQRQRAEVASLETLPSAQRNAADVARLNDWATQLSQKRTALEADRTRLLSDHDAVEAERAKLAQLRSDAQAKLSGQRDQTVGAIGANRAQRAAAYAQLRVATSYLRQAYADMARLAGRTVPHSATLDQAERKLKAFEAEPRSAR
jgi:hypothetical protein